MTEPQNTSGLMDQIHTLRLAKSQYEDTLVAVHAALDDTLGRDHRTRDDSAAAAIRRLAADAEKRGAVKALREQAERAEHDYLEFVNALQCRRGDADYWRWNGHAEALRAVATRLRELAGDEVPAYGSQEWREQHSVRAQAGTTP